MIPPTSPILNHEDAEENSHEMVIIQSDKTTGACYKNSSFVLKPIFSAKNKATNGKPVSKSDYDNSEKIIQAEVEICYS